MIPRKRFSEELEELKSKVIEMSSLAAALVEKAVKSLTQQDIELAESVAKEDEKSTPSNLKSKTNACTS